MDMDNLVGSAIDAGEDHLGGKEATNAKKENKFVRFLVSLIWGVIAFVVSLGAFLCMFGEGMSDKKELGYLAIGASALVWLLTFLIPYLRRKGTFTRWCGVLALGDAIWWAYILFVE